ncbi:MAG: MBL fold metallo-hydrolase [Bryobacterales bacterium]|nr:MBL fold metallo-hydrolase [Bryobacterales bacterium]
MSHTTLSGSEPRYQGGLQAVAEGVHCWLTPNGNWGESNAALIAGHGASLLVDTLWDLPLTFRMLSALEPVVANAPIRHLVNTHSDGDHWFGNELVGAETIIATEAAARVMAGHGPSEMETLGRLAVLLRGAGRVPAPGRWRWRAMGEYFGGMVQPFEFNGIRPALPNRTFSGRMTLEAGGRMVELIEAGPAHTEGDLLVHLPDTRTVFAGDLLFLGSTPVMWQGSAENWIRACERIMDLEPEVVLPGHGPVTGAAGVEAVRDYWRYVLGAARAEFERGTTAGAAARVILQGDAFRAQPFAAWDCPERLAINVDSIYRQLSGMARPRSLLERVRVLGRTALMADVSATRQL